MIENMLVTVCSATLTVLAADTLDGVQDICTIFYP